MRRPHECTQYLFLRWFTDGAAIEGQWWTCPVCGHAYRRAGPRWIHVLAIGDVAELVAYDNRPRLVYEGD